MRITTDNMLIHRYARKSRVYCSYYTYYTAEAEQPAPEPAIIEHGGLRLVVRNDFLPNPNVTSPHYHTGE